MSKRGYIWLFVILGIVVVILVLLVIFWDKLFPKDENEQKAKEDQDYKDAVEEANANNTTSPPPPSLSSGSLPVSSGDKNQMVKSMQEALIKMGAPISAGATGFFGSQTKIALEWAGYNGSTINNPNYNDILAGKKKTVASTHPTENVKGKQLWSVYGGTKVYVNEDGKFTKVYKTVDKGGYIGRISGTKYNNTWYLLSDDLYAVPVTSGVIVK